MVCFDLIFELKLKINLLPELYKNLVLCRKKVSL